MLILLCWFSLFSSSSAHAAQTLPIYYSTTLSAKSRQDALKSQIKKDLAEPVVFAKFKDFIDEVKQKKPAVLVAPSSFGQFYPDYKPVLQFAETEGSQFAYHVFALSNQWNSSNLSNGKAGIVEEVGHDHLKNFLLSLIHAKPKLVKSVSKAEDLFPLLVFKSADFILLSPSNYNRLKEQFNVKVYEVGESQPVNDPMVFVKKGASVDEVIQKLKGLPSATLATLGFNKIEGAAE